MVEEKGVCTSRAEITRPLEWNDNSEIWLRVGGKPDWIWQYARALQSSSACLPPLLAVSYGPRRTPDGCPRSLPELGVRLQLPLPPRRSLLMTRDLEDRSSVGHAGLGCMTISHPPIADFKGLAAVLSDYWYELYIEIK